MPMKMVAGVHNKPTTTTNNNQVETKSTWEQVTTHRAWRHTIGRISSAVRIPVYAAAVLAQAGKTAIKGVVAVVTFGQADKLFGACGQKFTFKAVARDAVMGITLVDRMVNSIICTAYAPPEKYRSLLEAMKNAGKIVFLDGYHHTDGRAHKVSSLFKLHCAKRAQYHKQIVQCDNISRSDLVKGTREHINVMSVGGVKIGNIHRNVDELRQQVKAG